ncbi:MAG: chemotaxis protein CheC [Lachnospiraceae bacterium]|jgi:chemotaxis protein CheC|nr:chemotaxis protein CheC [Lachnospiraceae bacterium]MCI6664675.1 chemotaxis protein CheC [Lachnospiraceae bacterium]MCI6977954.1 chemotaxis protein CheC [Lachnospiraceae bacterium]MDD6580665.1 chemotaxis protein CheC [Lachnospiraceae bacterium]MDO4509774.1 chemotaxis protein CheC [Lachnospiraceae bacterium]
MGAYDNLNDTQLDVMREIGNIGAGNACTALSGLIGTPIDMSVPRVQLLGIDSTSDYLGGDDKEVLGIRIDVKADLTGMMYHIVNKRFAERLINTFYEKKLDTIKSIDEMDMSVISEMGNITSGAYANALATLSGYVVDIGTPTPGGYSISEILKVPIETFGEVGDKILVVDEQFIIDSEKLTSNMILVLEKDSLHRLFDKLGVEH